MKKHFFIFLFCGGLFATEYAAIKPEEVETFKKQSCVLFHVWAAWCDICLEEMPKLLPELAKTKDLKPIVIDASSASERERTSQAFIKKQKTNLKTFYLSGVGDEALIKLIDPKWNGSLPYNALYHRGKIVKSWLGETGAAEMILAAKTKCH